MALSFFDALAASQGRYNPPSVAAALAGAVPQTPAAPSAPPILSAASPSTQSGYGDFSALDPFAPSPRAPAQGYGDFSLLDPFAPSPRLPAAGYGDFSALDPTLRKQWWQV